MQSVQEVALEIVAREGGYVNDPDDPGGPTKYGVTLHTMRRLGLDLNEDGRITASDVRLISVSHATDIFVTQYFNKPRIAELPGALQASVFDMYVNAGANAVRLLQQLFRSMGFSLAVDGVIGPKTITTARAAIRKAPDHLADAYGIARRNYYYQLADHRPTMRKYARRRDGGKGGWITRAEEFISPKYHLTQAQHAERISAWD